MFHIVPHPRSNLGLVAVLLPLADALLGSVHATVPSHGIVRSRWFWVLGILATLVGATLTVVGFMVQKYAHCHVKEKDKVRYWAEPRWLGGLAVWVAGQVICWLGDGLANRSLLACFNCWNIVVVFALAPFCFREQVSPRTSTGAAVVIGGCIWVILAGPRTYYEQTVGTIGEEWSSQSSIWTMLASALLPVAIGLRHGSRTVWSQKLASEEYAALSAFFAWYAVLLAKCTSTLFVTSVHKENQLGHYQFWLFGVLVVLCAVAQMHTLNLGLRSGTAVSVLPVYESFSMVGQVVICGIFFGEFRGLSIARLLFFCLGVLVVIGGVVMLVLDQGDTKAGATEEEERTFAGEITAPALAADVTAKRV